MPLAGIALPALLLVFPLPARLASTTVQSTVPIKSTTLQWGVSCWSAYNPLEFSGEAAQIHYVAGQGPSALEFTFLTTKSQGPYIADVTFTWQEVFIQGWVL